MDYVAESDTRSAQSRLLWIWNNEALLSKVLFQPMLFCFPSRTRSMSSTKESIKSPRKTPKAIKVDHNESGKISTNLDMFTNISAIVHFRSHPYFACTAVKSHARRLSLKPFFGPNHAVTLLKEYDMGNIFVQGITGWTLLRKPSARLILKMLFWGQHNRVVLIFVTQQIVHTFHFFCSSFFLMSFHGRVGPDSHS